jgi:outer membrane protein TolC
MRNLTIIFCIFLAAETNVFSQSSIDSIIADVVKNNTTLSALRKKVDSEKIGNKTGNYPQNPEVEFNYLWGSPQAMGNRTDLKVIQQFDFPSAYSYRNQISDLRNIQTELEYKKEYKSVILKARLLCIDLVYTNSFMNELRKRIADARSVADAYRSKFNTGEAGILEYNKAQLALLKLSNESEILEIDRGTMISELTGLNGGISIDFDETVFLTPALPADFEQWYLKAELNNPLLDWLKQEVTLSTKQEKLTTSLSLPKLQGGYMSEKVVGEQFQGITIGLSIPLWENRNEIKYAKARTLAVQSAEYDAKLQFYNRLKSLHLKAVNLQTNMAEYRSKLQIFSNSQLLKKALDKGAISLIDYIYELTFYYESVNRLLELERDVNKTVAELNQYQ